MAAADGSFPSGVDRKAEAANGIQEADGELDERLVAALARGGMEQECLLALRRRAQRRKMPLAGLIEEGPVSLARDATAALAGATDRSLALPGLDRAMPGQDAAAAIAAGMIRLTDGRIAVVPQGHRLSGLLADDPPPPGRIALATPQALLDLAVAGDADGLAERATETLPRRAPDLSSRGGAWPWQRTASAFLLAVFVAAFLDAGGGLSIAMAALGAVLFLVIALARAIAILQPSPGVADACLAHPAHVPVYSILVPLHRETAAVPGLVESLCRLDYPLARLDVLFLVESDDAVTLSALEALDMPSSFRIVRLPAGSPRTKPRACNIGLELARGDYLVIFDAEDRPEPLQLRHALAAFRDGGRDLAVVQARLTIDPRQTGVLPALFRADYAGLFTVMLPALARFDLPIPLGGTSNHFRTKVLRSAGGWDAYNVTEDADLGLRLGRLGHRATMMSSTTFEEAPATAMAWLRQRTRWLKGWMVTMIVHSRDPGRLLEEVGAKAAVAFFLMTGGIVAATLLEPISIVLLAATFLRAPPQNPALEVLRDICLASFVLGHVTALILAIRGCLRIGRLPGPWLIALFPLYWAAMSVAAWRAFFQLIRDPHGWEKTEHLLARRQPRRSKAQGPGRLGIGEKDGRPMGAP